MSSGRLATVIVVAGWLGVTAIAADASPSDGFCRSDKFRQAFLEGQREAAIDYARPGHSLIAYGNEALPCLAVIFDVGGETLGIEGCESGHVRCRSWAFSAIRLIGTQEARQFFLRRLETENDPGWLVKTIVALGSLREESARPQLRSLLGSDDPAVRIACITALGAIGRRADFAAMSDSVGGLPDEDVAQAVHGFRVLGDPRGLRVFEVRAQSISDETARVRTERALRLWRAEIAKEDVGSLERVLND